MDRTREGRRSSMSATTTTNGFPRRRHRTIGLRDSFEEGQVELQETVRLRAVACKRDRDRDRDRDSSSNKGKRRKASHREEGEQSTEESVGSEDDYVVQDVSRMFSPNTASSVSDQNHRRSFPTSRPLRPTPPPWKVADEMIGVPVPRKARSASAKRSHDSWASASGGTEEQNFGQQSNSPGRLSVESTSPSSSNFSVRKKKSAGPETRLPNAFKSSSSPQEDIEIEIAEVLYGLMTTRNQETSQKLESNDTHGTSHDSKTLVSSQITYAQTSILPRSSSPLSRPFNDENKTKMQDFGTMVSNNSTAESVKIASEQPGNVETLPPEPAKILSLNDDNSAGREAVSSEATKEDNGDNWCSGTGYDVTTNGRSVVTRKLSSCSRLNVDKQDFAAKRVKSAVTEVKSQRVEKFEIDLMAPPPMVLSPEREGLSRGDFTSESMTLDVELKREDNIKFEDRVERIVKKEKAPEETEETKMNAFKGKQDLLKHDLEKATRDNDSLTSNKLEEQDRNREEPPALTYPEVEKTAPSCSAPLSTSGWLSSFPPLGYMPPMQTSGKIDTAIEASTAPQHANFGFSAPPPKRCATHHYVACNILLHQKSVKTNHFVPSAAVSSSFCSTKPNNMDVMPSAESMVIGKQSQQNLPDVNQDVAQEKGWAATGLSGLTANKRSDAVNSKDSKQSKQLVIQQGPRPASAGNLVDGPALLFPHQASVTQATSQAGGDNSTISAVSSNKPNSSAGGSLGTSATMPAVAAAISFSYPNLAGNDAPYMTIVQNNGYPFPFSTPIGATPTIRGANPAQATPLLNVPFYSSQMFHPLQHPQQHPHSQTLVQPSYLNTSTSNGSSSSSQKQQRGVQVNGNNILTSTNIQLQQSQKQHTSLPLPRKFESEMSGENAQSVASRTSYSQKNAYGRNFTIPFQPVNFSFRPSVASDSVSGNGGNLGDKQQQHQQALKGGVEHIPSQAFAISFGTFNGTSVPSNLNFSSVPQNPVIFQSLPDVAWQGYQAAVASHTTQQKTYSTSEGKNGGNSTRQDDEKKTIPGKSSTNGPTTLVFDNSSKNFNFMLSPMTGSWPSHSVASSAITTNVPSSQQPPHLVPLQKQHSIQKQQHPIAAQFKGSSINNASATKFANNPPVVSQTLAHGNSSNQPSQSKSSGRSLDSQVHPSSIETSTAPSLKNFSQEQGRVLQGHTQISFGGNYKASLSLQGQQLFSNNQPLCITVSGSLPNGGNMNPNSQGSKVGSSINTSQIQQNENSSAGTGQKSSPVCGRNVPSILSSRPSHLSELK